MQMLFIKKKVCQRISLSPVEIRLCGKQTLSGLVTQDALGWAGVIESQRYAYSGTSVLTNLYITKSLV